MEVDPVGELYGQRRGEVDGWAAGMVVGEAVEGTVRASLRGLGNEVTDTF